MQAGELDQRISLKHRSLRGDGSGGAVNTPVVYATVWAHVRPERGNEKEQFQRMEAVSSYIVTIRYRDDVVEGDAIIWGTRTLNVRFVRDAGVRKPWLEIEADKGVSGV